MLQKSEPASVGTDEWRNFASVFSKLRPPLRPAPGDVASFAEAITGFDSSVLLLGVTPELAPLGEELVAVDNAPKMLARVWPGDSPCRRAMLADWTSLPFADASFTAAIGDASLNAAPGNVGEVLAEAARVLTRGGKLAIRSFCSPERPESLEAIADDVAAGWRGNLHALKWRVAMAIAPSYADFILPVRDILSAFNRLFPDRAALAERTGWTMDEIATLDAYRDADHSLAFPTLDWLLAAASPLFASARIVANSGYPLAERCPTIVWTAA